MELPQVIVALDLAKYKHTALVYDTPYGAKIHLEGEISGSFTKNTREGCRQGDPVAEWRLPIAPAAAGWATAAGVPGADGRCCRAGHIRSGHGAGALRSKR